MNYYCAVCGKSHHEVSEMAIMNEIPICCECTAIIAGIFLTKGPGSFKQNIELLLSVSKSQVVKTA